MSAETKKYPTAYIIHSVISVALMLTGWFVPPFAGITELGMKVLFIFLGSVYAWCLVEFVWPSIVAMLILGLSGWKSVSAVFTGGFGDPTVMGLLFVFVFIAILDESKLTDWIANWLLSKKVFQGKPWLLMAAIFYLNEVLAAIVNLFGVTIMMWSIFSAICRQCGYKKGDRFVSYAITAIMFLPTMAIHYYPFLPLPIVVAGMVTNIVPGFEIPYGAWYIYGITMTILFPLVFLFLGRFVLRIDLSAMKNLDMDQIVKAEKLTKEQKFCFVLLGIFILILVLPAVLPAGVLKAGLSNFGIIGAACTVVVIACLRRTADGSRITNFTRVAGKGLNWDMLCMFAATYPISAALESAECGIISTVLAFITPIFQSMGGLAFIIITFVVLGALTQVMHNLVLLLALLPTLAGVALSLGINPLMYGILLGVLLQTAFMTPGASAQSALVFGNTEMISSKDAVIHATIQVATAWIVIFAVCVPLGFVLF